MAEQNQRTQARYASLDEVALYLGVGRRTVRSMIARGDLTGFRLPGSRLIRVDLREVDLVLKPIIGGRI